MGKKEREVSCSEFVFPYFRYSTLIHLLPYFPLSPSRTTFSKGLLLSKIKKRMTRICVFCGSSMGFGKEYKVAAERLGDFFSANKIELVYGGADVGLMKVIADNMLVKGSHVIGVMPGHLVERGVVHHNLSQLITVETMAERKQIMVELSDGFIALPGGFGTLDELSEILTYNQLRISDKPLGFLNVNHYFDHLFQFFDHAATAGFVRKEHFNNLIVSDNINELFSKMNKYNPLEIGKWIEEIKVESNHQL